MIVVVTYLTATMHREVVTTDLTAAILDAIIPAITVMHRAITKTRVLRDNRITNRMVIRHPILEMDLEMEMGINHD